MEIFELRYFSHVAQLQNIHRAAEKLHVSPASLSKAVARLEDELHVKLFERHGRNIRLTDQGRLLQRRASEMLRLEESARWEVSGPLGVLQVVMAGPEVLLSKMGLEFGQRLKTMHASARFEFHLVDDAQALEQVAQGEAHLALVTSDVPAKLSLSTKELRDSHFHTYVGRRHALYAAAQKSQTLPISEVLRHGFVSPSNPMLGKVGIRQSLDGWRDDKFPRKVEYLTSSIKILEELVVGGKALAYLPDYFGETLELSALDITGCPYSCSQKIRLVARNPQDQSWLPW